MTVPLQDSALILRQRFGTWIQAKREEQNHTQASAAAVLELGWPAMVSQVERGKSAMPPHDIQRWSRVLGVTSEELAKEWLYFIQPFVYQALYGQDPYAREKLPRPQSTIKAAPGKPLARASR